MAIMKMDMGNYVEGYGNGKKITAGVKEDSPLSFKNSLTEALSGDGRIRSRKTIVTDQKMPYSHLVKDGLIEYNGVVFVCDYKINALCLGDMSDPDAVLSIPLAGGGLLKVNRDNIDDLVSAIGMFSPEDVNRILRALSEDAECSKKIAQIEDMKNRLGKEKEEN